MAALLSDLRKESFRNRDEEEVAGYAAAMELIFESWDALPVTENHIRQLHRVLLQYSGKDERHRGDYKTNPNNGAAFDAEGKQSGIVFETASPFDAPWPWRSCCAGWKKPSGQGARIRSCSRAFSSLVFGHSSVSRWQWQTFARARELVAAAFRLCLRAVFKP